MNIGLHRYLASSFSSSLFNVINFIEWEGIHEYYNYKGNLMEGLENEIMVIEHVWVPWPYFG